jgi:hypothetical protein
MALFDYWSPNGTFSVAIKVMRRKGKAKKKSQVKIEKLSAE